MKVKVLSYNRIFDYHEVKCLVTGEVFNVDLVTSGSLPCDLKNEDLIGKELFIERLSSRISFAYGVEILDV